MRVTFDLTPADYQRALQLDASWRWDGYVAGGRWPSDLRRQSPTLARDFWALLRDWAARAVMQDVA